MALVANILLGQPNLSGAEPARDSHTVAYWNAVTARALAAACLVPGRDDLWEARTFAAVQVAVHDALNGIEGRFQRRSGSARSPYASSAMVAAAATRTVLLSLLHDRAGVPQRCVDDARGIVDEAYARMEASSPVSRAKSEGISLGESAGREVLDHPVSSSTSARVGPSGVWPPKTPYLESSVEYTRDFEEVQTLGGDGVHTASARTPEQTETVRFWRQSAAQIWNGIARNVALTEPLDEWDTARLFALLDLALADAAAVSRATRYATNYWTPVSAIRSADTDANPGTRADLRWTPLQPVSLTGGYDSAQAVAAGGAAAVLRIFFGSDMRTFSACLSTVEEFGTTCDPDHSGSRTFHSFSQAANESGWSEILAGVHFRRAVRSGLDRGAHIAEAAYGRQLAPVEQNTTGKNGCAASHHRPRLLGLIC